MYYIFDFIVIYRLPVVIRYLKVNPFSVGDATVVSSVLTWITIGPAPSTVRNVKKLIYTISFLLTYLTCEFVSIEAL